MRHPIKLFEHLKVTGFGSPRIEEAFKSIDRADFVLPAYQDVAYLDTALPIGHAATISQPTTVLFMLGCLDPMPGEKILDLGSGSGWTTALLSKSVGKQGQVYGVEIVPELVEWSKSNLAKYNLPQAQIYPAGAEMGLPSLAPFDKILVSAAGKEKPQELVRQLRVGGRMVVPIKNSIWQIDKLSESKTLDTEFEGFVFVPLRKAR